MTYGIALVLVVLATRERSLRPLLVGGAALALGLSLAAFYIIPAAFEQRWVNISETLSVGLQFPENFLFTHVADPEHTQFNFVVSCVAIEVIAGAFAGLVLVGELHGRHPRLLWVLTVVGGVSTLLMFPLTAPIWEHVPKLRYVQFPWRWLLLLDVPFAFCVNAAMARLRGAGKHFASAGALGALAITGFLLTRGNWWDVGAGADYWQTHFTIGQGYFGTDEYGPLGSDHYDLDEHAPMVRLRSDRGSPSESKARVQIQQWRPTRKQFVVQSPEPVTAALRLMTYPAWAVDVNGKRVRASAEQSGQMMVSLPAGTSRVQIAFTTTPDRLWGDIISAIAALSIAGAVLFRRRRAAEPMASSAVRSRTG